MPYINYAQQVLSCSDKNDQEKYFMLQEINNFMNYRQEFVFMEEELNDKINKFLKEKNGKK